MALKKRYIGLSMLFLFFTVHAQKQDQQRIDSLTPILPRLPEDTQKVREMLHLSQAYIEINIEKASEIAGEAMQLAKKIQWKKGIINAYITLGGISNSKGDFEKALQYDGSALALSQEAKDERSIAFILGNIGLIYSDKADYPKALEYLFSALKLKEQIGNHLSTAQTLGNIGNIYFFEKDYTKALEYYFKSLVIKQQIGDVSGTGNMMANIGSVYLQQGKYDLALKYNLKNIEIKKKTGNKLGEATGLGNIAEIYLKQKNFKDAVTNIYKAIQLAEKLQSKRDLTNYYKTLADIYYGIVADNFRSNLPDSLKNKTHNLSMALTYYRKTIDLDIHSGNIVGLAQSYQSVSETQFLAGDYKNAVINYRKSSYLKDSNAAKETQKLIQNLENKRITYIKDKQIEIEQIKLREAKTERLYLISGLLFLLLLTGILYNQFIIKKRSNERLEEANHIKSRLFFIISHDLRSPLNSLDAALQLMQSKAPGNESVQSILQRLDVSVHATSNLIDNLLTWSNSQMEGTKLYPENLSLKDSVNQVITVYKNIAALKNIDLLAAIDRDTTVFVDGHILKLVIRNLVDNAIKFSNAGSVVEITSQKLNGNILLIVTDSGTGMNETLQKNLFSLKKSIQPVQGTGMEKGAGLGLSLCYELIIKTGGDIAVESVAGKGSRFIVTLPSSIFSG